MLDTDVRSPSPPAVPRTVGIVAFALVAAAAFVALALQVWHDVGPLHFDDRVAAQLPRVDRETVRYIRALSLPGNPIAVVLESLVVAGLAWMRTRNTRVAVFCACTPILVGITADLVMKPLIERQHTRFSDAFVFPSGHVTGITSVAVVAWLCVVATWSSITARVAGAAVLLVGVAAVGLSRLWIGAHYATDVIGGVLYALAATLAIGALVLRRTGALGLAQSGAVRQPELR